jgi:hypothetical protein
LAGAFLAALFPVVWLFFTRLDDFTPEAFFRVVFFFAGLSRSISQAAILGANASWHLELT